MKKIHSHSDLSQRRHPTEQTDWLTGSGPLFASIGLFRLYAQESIFKSGPGQVRDHNRKAAA